MIELDHAAFGWVVAHRVSALDLLMHGLSIVGRGGMIWMAIALVLLGLHRLSWRDGVKLLLALLVATLVGDHVIKPIVNRQRPFDRTPGILVIGSKPSDASFPSGHTANAFAGAFTLASVAAVDLSPIVPIAYWLLAAGIGYSRMYVGVHYPLDVMAGAFVGVACAWSVGRLPWWRLPWWNVGTERQRHA